jgi:hypothetical protein
MRKRIFIPTLTLVLFSLGVIIYFNSCKKNSAVSTNEVDITKEYTLTEKALLDDNIYLPEGTKWKYVSKDGGEVKFTLPKGFAFLNKDLNTGTYYIDPDPGGGGYSCTCSDSNSCKVFYQKDLGYGCLQNTCTGSCTGKPTSSQRKQILGVLNTENDQLELEKITTKASLSEEGRKAFFQLPQVQAEIKKNYDFVYANIVKPDFEKIDPNNLPSNYFIGVFSLYGQQVGLLLPKDESLLKARPELRTNSVAPTSCTCSGTPGGDNCKLHKDCILGYCAYSCSGCTTCTMN